MPSRLVTPEQIASDGGEGLVGDISAMKGGGARTLPSEMRAG
jgi:hypothetical protein